MMIGWKSAVTATLLGLLTMPAVATSPAAKSHRPATVDAQSVWLRQSAATLSRLPDANSLVAAALLQLFDHSQMQMPLLDQAAQADPAGADIAARAQITCTFVNGCNAIERADRLHAIDPDNALAWMPRLRAAREQGDETQVTRLLQRMAQSPRFQTYALDIVNRVDDALKSLPPNPDPLFQTTLGADASRELVARFMTLAASPIPAFQSIVRPCAPSAVQYPQRRTACRQIGLLLEASNGHLARNIGLALHRRAATNAADYATALASERRMDWQYLHYANFVSRATPDTMASFVHEELRLLSDSAAMQAQLKKDGLPLDPPAGWVDKTEADRIAADKRELAAAQPGSSGTR